MTAFLERVRVTEATFNIRPISENEVIDAARILCESAPWKGLGYRVPQLQSFLGNQTTEHCHDVLTLDGTPIGYFSHRPNWFFGPFVSLIYITPKFRGRDYASTAVTQLMARAKHEKRRQIWASVDQNNPKALTFFMFLGFKNVAHIPDLIQTNDTEILLRKSLL